MASRTRTFRTTRTSDAGTRPGETPAVASSRTSAPIADQPLTVDSVLALQRSVGNQAVVNLLSDHHTRGQPETNGVSAAARAVQRDVINDVNRPITPAAASTNPASTLRALYVNFYAKAGNMTFQQAEEKLTSPPNPVMADRGQLTKIAELIFDGIQYPLDEWVTIVGAVPVTVPAATAGVSINDASTLRSIFEAVQSNRARTGWTGRGNR